MKAEVSLKCSKCGKTFLLAHGVETQEEKENWEKWAKETYKSPYCPACARSKSAELEVMKGNIGGFTTAVGRILGSKDKD